MNDPLQEYLTVAVEAARVAGRMLKENLAGIRQISFKGTIDMVTEMDRASERTIVERIHASYPGHGVIAEEGSNVKASSGFLWIIDPLDGTTNYAHGFPNFSVSIALQKDGELSVGVVYEPLRDELFTAVMGRGAAMSGVPLHVSTTDQLIRSLLATGFPYDRAVSAENNLDYFNAMIMASQEIRRCGSAALDLCSVAAGRLDGYWELKLKPWDVAAGSLIVREAGGTVSDLSGGASALADASIVASNGVIHEQMLAVLTGAKKKPS